VLRIVLLDSMVDDRTTPWNHIKEVGYFKMHWAGAGSPYQDVKVVGLRVEGMMHVVPETRRQGDLLHSFPLSRTKGFDPLFRPTTE
jgi:hypothetical protein